MRCGLCWRPISAITASCSPGLMCVMYTSVGRCSDASSPSRSDGHRCRLMLASGRSSLRKAVSMTSMRTSSSARRAHSAALGPVSPVKTQQPPSGPMAAKPTAGTVCEAGSTSTRCPPSDSTSPTAKGTKARMGCSALGSRVKSGQITPLKTCRRRASIVSGSACTCTGGRCRASRLRVTLSASRPMESTWSRCEWLTTMWSMAAISSSVRSPTPVPASTRTSWPIRKDVVRQPAAMEPEQPRTRICMGGGLLGALWSEAGQPVAPGEGGT